MATLSTYKFNVANGVLAEFKKIIKSDKTNRKFELGAYSNGREQGYSLSTWDMERGLEYRGVKFSENRNSDDIVIYPEVFICESLSDEAYSKKIFKSSKDFRGAALTIYEWLTESIWK